MSFLKYIKKTLKVLALTGALTFAGALAACGAGKDSVVIVPINSYATVGRPFDCKTLFSIKVNGEEVAVTDDMIDVGTLNVASPVQGIYEIKLTYVDENGNTHTQTATVNVRKTFTIQAPEVKTITEGEEIDVKSLFTISSGIDILPATDDMLTLGGFNPKSPVAGEYRITLQFISAKDGIKYSKTITIVVEKKKSNVVIGGESNSTAYAGDAFDATKLFTITENGAAVTVTEDMISFGSFNRQSPAVGTYELSLTYSAQDGNIHTATATVIVVKKPAVVDLITISKTTLTVGEQFDCKTLFTLTVDGQSVPVTDEMLSLNGFNGANTPVGSYQIAFSYQVEGKTYTGTATVVVEEAPVITVAVSIAQRNAQFEEGTPFDCKTLFTLTVDGQNVLVTDEMLTLNGFNGANPAPGEYEIDLSYTATDGETHISTAKITVDKHIYAVIIGSVQQTDVYEGDALNFDVKSLFTITADGQNVPVTDQMLDLDGLDVTSPIAGEYEIVCTYLSADGVTHTKSALIIVTRRATVVVTCADQTYAYQNDVVDFSKFFTVTVDGKAYGLTEEMFDFGGLNLQAPVEGSYTVKLSFIYEGIKHEKSITVIVPKYVKITAPANMQVVNAGKAYDAKPCFTIIENGQNIQVTDDMIDYGKLNASSPVEGNYTVTLTYTSSDNVVYKAYVIVRVREMSTEDSSNSSAFY